VQFLDRFLGLADEAVDTVGAEEEIGALLPAADVGAAFNLDFAVLGDVAGVVLDVPAERAEQRVQKLLADAGLVVAVALVVGDIAAEDFDQAAEFPFKGVEGGLGIGGRRGWRRCDGGSFGSCDSRFAMPGSVPEAGKTVQRADRGQIYG
jgi:hypothetical protein